MHNRTVIKTNINVQDYGEHLVTLDNCCQPNEETYAKEDDVNHCFSLLVVLTFGAR